jgi:hypothetical protein
LHRVGGVGESDGGEFSEILERVLTAG